MKIPEIPPDTAMVSYVQQSGKTATVQKPQVPLGGGNQVPTEDKVDLSPESKEMKRIHDILAATPDIRSDRVDFLKKLVESGQYEIKSDEVASKMIKDFLAEMNS